VKLIPSAGIESVIFVIGEESASFTSDVVVPDTIIGPFKKATDTVPDRIRTSISDELKINVLPTK
jgi:hypothetical protein